MLCQKSFIRLPPGANPINKILRKIIIYAGIRPIGGAKNGHVTFFELCSKFQSRAKSTPKKFFEIDFDP